MWRKGWNVWYIIIQHNSFEGLGWIKTCFHKIYTHRLMNNYYQLMVTVKSKHYYTFVNTWARTTISYSILLSRITNDSWRFTYLERLIYINVLLDQTCNGCYGNVCIFIALWRNLIFVVLCCIMQHTGIYVSWKRHRIGRLFLTTFQKYT